MADVSKYIDGFFGIGSKANTDKFKRELLERLISYETQTLSSPQQIQARENIGALGEETDPVFEAWLSANPYLTVEEDGSENFLSIISGKLSTTLPEIYGATLDPTGFVDNNSIVATYSTADLKITLTKTGGISWYWRGVKKTMASPYVSAARTAGNGAFFLSSTDGVNFAWGVSPWLFSEIQVAMAVQGSTYHFGMYEVHGLRSWQEHRDQHNIDGTLLASGGTITAGTYIENTATDAANSMGFNAAVLRDEDIDLAIPAWIEGTYTTLYIGASGEPIFSTVDTLPFRSAGSYLLVNNPTDGTNTAGVNNKYYNVYQLLIPTTADSDSQKFWTVMVQPQATFDSLAAAQAESITGINLGQFATLAPEFKFYTRITYVTAAGDNNTGKCRIATGGISYVTGSKNNPISVSGVLSSNHQALSNLGWASSGHTGTISNIAIFDATGAASFFPIATMAKYGTITTGYLSQFDGTNLINGMFRGASNLGTNKGTFNFTLREVDTPNAATSFSFNSIAGNSNATAANDFRHNLITGYSNATAATTFVYNSIAGYSNATAATNVQFNSIAGFSNATSATNFAYNSIA